jgi:hypothetical protein
MDQLLNSVDYSVENLCILPAESMILGIIPNYEELQLLVYDSRNNPQL